MSSKLNLKSSKQARPKSSEKLKGKKGGGTPEKSTTPNQSQDASSDENRPASRGVIMDEEIERLIIREEELEKLREPRPPTQEKTRPPVAMTVRKRRPVDQAEKPKPQPLTVFKPAPPDAPLRPMDYSGIAGPRYDMEGNVLPYSLLGAYEDFRAEAIKRGDLLDISGSKAEELQPRIPTIKYEKKKRESVPLTTRPDESNALRNWQLRMMERKKQQGYISRLLEKPPQKLIMNQADTYHQTQEERYIIDRTIPAIDYGKGYRVGSEFWKQQERIGNELTGVHMTLSQTERGYPPPIEHVGLARSIKAEKGYWASACSTPVHYPWDKSPYLVNRKQQLQKIIDELDPHHPDFGGLEVIGSSRPTHIIHTAVPEEFTAPSPQDKQPETPEGPLESSDPLRDHPNVHPAPVFGPSIKFAGQSARWTGDGTSFCDQLGIEARVTFETYAGDRVTSFLEIVNDGTTSIYYNWKRLPKSNPFDLVHAKVQRFYFNTSNGVILPGDTMRFPFVFKSPNAGVFSEQWAFETRPVVCGGATLIVSLRGIALQEDKFKVERVELERELAHKQAEQVVGQILQETLDAMRSPVRSRSAMDAYLTDQDIFCRLNSELAYHHRVVSDLRQLYSEIFPDGEGTWNMSVSDLKQTLMCLDEDHEEKEAFLQRLNEAVISLSFPIVKPLQQNMHRVGYQLLLEAVDGIVGQAMMLRSVMGLPDSEDSEHDDGKRSKHAEKKEAKDVPKKGPSAKEPKSAAKTKEAAKPDPKGKSTPVGKKSVPQPRSDTATHRSKDGADRAFSPTSPPTSPPPPPDNGDPVLYRKYKEKLHLQAYQILGETVDKIETAFIKIQETDGTPDLGTLISR